MKLEITKEKVLEAAEKCESAKETLKTLFPEVFEKTYKIGDFFTNHSEISILAQVEASRCAFISMVGGNRYSDPIIVKDALKITEAELTLMRGGNGGHKKIDNPFKK